MAQGTDHMCSVSRDAGFSSYHTSLGGLLELVIKAAEIHKH